MTFWNKNKVIFNNNPLIPNSVRLLIIGATNEGKTALLLKMIVNGWFDFNSLHICSPSLVQHEFQILIQSYEAGLTTNHIKKIFENQEEIDNYQEAIKKIATKIKVKTNISVQTYKESDSIPSPEEIRKDIEQSSSAQGLSKNSKILFICDDLLTKNQQPIQELFVYSRHFGINVVYLSQSYFKLNRQTIRLNANLFIFFRLNVQDIENIWRDLCSIDFKIYSEFQALIEKVFDEQYNFLTINLEKNNIREKYTKNFETPLIDLTMLSAKADLIFDHLPKADLLKLINNNKMITQEEQNKKLLEINESNKELINIVREKKNQGISFQSRQKEVFKPIIEKLDETKPISTPKTTPIPIISLEMIKELMNKPESDKLFGLVEFADGNIRFGIFDDITQHYAIPDHYFEFIPINNEQVKANESLLDNQKIKNQIILHKDKETDMKKDLTVSLLTYLTIDVENTGDRKGQSDYKDLLKLAFGDFISELFKLKRGDIRKSLFLRFQENKKYTAFCKELFDVKISKGTGYLTLALKPILIPPNQPEQINRVLILLGSKRSGTNSEEADLEFNGILDELYRNKTINKEYYKILYYKYKNGDSINKVN